MKLQFYILAFIQLLPERPSEPIKEWKTYENYHLLEIYPKTIEHVNILHSLQTRFDFWTLRSQPDSTATVFLAPHEVADMQSSLHNNSMQFHVKSSNFAPVIERHRQQQALGRKEAKHLKAGEYPFNRYFPRYKEIDDYLERLARKHWRTVQLETAGKSHEGRDVKYMVISRATNKHNGTSRKVIVVDAAIHAREWMSPQVGLFAIHQLVERAVENADLLRNIDWVILPVFNPDGLEYSHTNERMWRKNRQPNGDSECIGTDLNRNFALEWGGPGSSDDVCMETYRGTAAFSAPESRLVRDVLEKYSARCKFYLTIHTCGQCLIHPWGYTAALPSNWRDMDAVGRAGAKAMEAFSKLIYEVGSSTHVLGKAAGGSDDYALGTQKIPISFTMELSKEDQCFVPPPKRIPEAVQEAWIGIRAMARKVDNMYS